MSVRERPVDRGSRRGNRTLDELLREFRDARHARNLSQTVVGRAVGLSDSQISAIELGQHRQVPFVLLAQLLGAVGLDLSARAYPSGGGLRDEAQAKLLGRLRNRVGGAFTWRTEVPMPIDGDLRAWDGALIAASLRIGIDAETRLRDVQAVDRRVMLKLRDSGFDRAVVLVAATRSNRLALRDAGNAVFANYPIPARAALRALAAGDDPGGNCLIVL